MEQDEDLKAAEDSDEDEEKDMDITVVLIIQEFVLPNMSVLIKI